MFSQPAEVKCFILGVPLGDFQAPFPPKPPHDPMKSPDGKLKPAFNFVRLYQDGRDLSMNPPLITIKQQQGFIDLSLLGGY